MTSMAQLSLSTAKNVERSLKLMSTAAAGMAAGITASLTASMLKAENFAFSMSKFAEKTGSSVEQFSKLAYAAKLAGVPIDMVKGAMERLARTSGAAQGRRKPSQHMQHWAFRLKT